VNTTLHIRRLGTLPYDVARELQDAAWRRDDVAWLLLLQHPHLYTFGARGRADHLLVDPTTVGASATRADRGGDVTYHGPGQLVGYPIVDVPFARGAIPEHVRNVESVVIDALQDLGLAAARRAGYPGVWIADRKIASVGVRVTRGRSLHGFALNVAPDLSMFDHIVPCGIRGCRITSLAAEGVDAQVEQVCDATARHATRIWGADGVDDRVMDAAELDVELRCSSSGARHGHV
jgi:lipoic acid synthetase